MFFGKPKQPTTGAASPVPSLAWDEPGRLRQSMRLAVSGWNFTASPMLQARAGMQFGFDFEGTVGNGAMRGLTYLGSIEVLNDPPEPPRMLMDRWSKVPEVVEGHGELLERTDPSFPDTFSLTLYCTQAALDWVYRAFVNGLHSRHGGLALDLTLACPNNKGGDFWDADWRKETLQVLTWRVVSNAA
jgi:hypothetical protein